MKVSQKRLVRGLSAAIIALAASRRQRKRRVWIKEWITKRERYGAYHCLLNELGSGDRQGYRNFLRMDQAAFSELLEKVEPLIRKQDTHLRPSIPPGERLAITLRYLATGDSYSSLQYLYWVSKQAISEIVPEVCEAIYCALKEDYLKMPNGNDEWQAISQRFHERWNFANCVGAIDGKHVVIQAPANSGSYYFNYKGTFSVVLLAVVDADYNFTYIDIGCNGRISDGGVFKNSTLSDAIESNKLQITSECLLPGTDVKVPYAFVADDAFPLKTTILKPYSQRGLTKEQRIFNYRLSRARRIVENAFDILANRFRVFMKAITLEPCKVESIVLASVTLHNFLRSKPGAMAVYAPHGSFDSEDRVTGAFIPGSWRQAEQPQGLIPIHIQPRGRQNQNAKDNRDTLCRYFNSAEGAVDWQWTMVEK